MDLKVPVVFVVPLTWSYSYLDAGEESSGDAEGTDGSATESDPEAADDAPESARDRPEASDRDAVYIGLGDAVMPTVLVVSAGVFLDTPALVTDTVLTLPALTALVGTMVGLLVLVRFVMRGRAHAGLPLLNGGAIAGYLVGALVAGVPLLDALGLASYL
jgi:presenilin-like A22 family membrane protease